jgi:hypothetical protein
LYLLSFISLLLLSRADHHQRSQQLHNLSYNHKSILCHKCMRDNTSNTFKSAHILTDSCSSSRFFHYLIERLVRGRRRFVHVQHDALNILSRCFKHEPGAGTISRTDTLSGAHMIWL